MSGHAFLPVLLSYEHPANARGIFDAVCKYGRRRYSARSCTYSSSVARKSSCASYMGTTGVIWAIKCYLPSVAHSSRACPSAGFGFSLSRAARSSGSNVCRSYACSRG